MLTYNQYLQVVRIILADDEAYKHGAWAIRIEPGPVIGFWCNPVSFLRFDLRYRLDGQGNLTHDNDNIKRLTLS